MTHRRLGRWTPWTVCGQPLRVVIDVTTPPIRDIGDVLVAVALVESVALGPCDTRIVLNIAKRSDNMAADTEAQVAEVRRAWCRDEVIEAARRTDSTAPVP